MACPEANARFETAIKDLQRVLTSSDATAFKATTPEDVWKAAEEIQESQRKRKSLRAMRRIEPFLKALDGYSEVMSVVCNGTPFVPWIWAPIKLMLQLANEHASAFDKLIEAYEQIQKVLPMFNQLHKTFGDDEQFQIVLSWVYKDILEFHQAAYRFFRRRQWVIFFDSLWKGFQFRFESILKKLAQHQKLLMQQVNVIDAIDARRWRLKYEDETRRQEHLIQKDWLHDSISWLKTSGELRDDELERLLGKRQEGTCEWIFTNPVFQTWKDDAFGESTLWVKGIPGAGKTILSAHIIDTMKNGDRNGITTAYHICNSYTTGKDLRGEIMRSIAAQLLQNNLELAPFIFENYANKGLEPSIAHLRNLIPELLGTIPSVRVIVDGLDEYPESEQTKILTELIQLTKPQSSQCKILFSSREGKQINQVLNKKPIISLRDQDQNINRDIQIYVQAFLSRMRDDFGNELIDKVERRIIEQSNGCRSLLFTSSTNLDLGMFLWPRLVMNGLLECGSRRELTEAINTLPEGLDEAYGRILKHIQEGLGPMGSNKAIRILEWIACSFRVMRVHEIQDGIVLHTMDMELSEDTKLSNTKFLDLCKPLIEEGPNNTVDFVHYSAKEYILNELSGPFLHYSNAHYRLAFSCMNYMKSTSHFINPHVTENTRKVRVIRGFHGLHHYANEFWFQHLLQYAKAGDPIEDDELDFLVEYLSIFWKQEPGLGASQLKLDDTTSTDGISRQVEVLADMPQAQKMGIDMLTFRRFMSQEKQSHQNPDSLREEQLKYDPTWFSEISQAYDDIVRSLLASSAHVLPKGVHPKDLEKFREIYSDSAFTCRYHGCERYSDGFGTAADRDKHENVHAKPLRCLDPTCEFWARGFSSRTGLQKHNRKYHPSQDELPLPDFKPRREEQLPKQAFVPATWLSLSPQPSPPVDAPRANRQMSLRDSESETLETGASPRAKTRRGLKDIRVHGCDRCKKIFTRAESLRRHALVHEPPKFPCQWENCGRAFFRADLLQRHEEKHEPRKYF